MKRLLTWALALPFGLVAVALAVANRRPVTLVLDPFRPEHPAFAVVVPLFVVIFAALILGVVLGGLTVWWRQGVHRRAARQGRRETRRLATERDRLTAQVAEKDTAIAALALPAPGGARRAA